MLLLWSNFTLMLTMLILVGKENEQGKAHIFQDTYFKSSQIYQLPIIYRV